jgi:predicted DNA-binding transcriptional regulator AlpA
MSERHKHKTPRADLQAILARLTQAAKPSARTEQQLLRVGDIIALGFINSRSGLYKRLNQGHFPPGRLLTPSDRVWTEAEVRRWFLNRPTALKKMAKTIGRPRKRAA